ncbi:D-glycerate dehydrogenase [Patescibacteria group bacterium]|uniref:D-glycerate dehydrogenase n=1 Tax=candidate division WWE3 bacterium TaxID=2053526 RepID=A0A928TVI4_UNCKA|nr:D-glycerate dehydrogenase [Anaerolineales bacterium]MBE7525170.1 D-glycerate dehydrogenase [candidate division WWE3 bacterium]MCL4733147.1 D-glycerate dehydrogenase [Patescibacteria group bacterium]
MNIFISFNPKGFAENAVRILKKAGHAVTVYPKVYGISRKELLRLSKGRDAVLPLLTDRIDEEFFRAAGPKLKIVANYAVGFDNVDLQAAKKHGVIVTNTPTEAVNESVGEHTFALMLTLAHRIAEADRFSKGGKYTGWKPDQLLGSNLRGKTLGIIGAGRIGSNVAFHAVNGFGMKLLYSDMKRNPDIEKTFRAKYVSMDALLKQSDYVSLHVPLLPSTKHLISAKQLRLMKKTAFLINTARGPVVDEKALLKALKAKKIAGAALDVFECEPAIDCDLRDDLELKAFENVILTPHIASATIEAREGMAEVAAKNIVAVLAGKKPLTPAKV